MDKLIAYLEISNLKELNIDSDSDLIITAYKDTTKRITEEIKNVQVVSMGEIINELFSFWSNKEKQYENIVKIRKLINGKKESNILKRFNKSINEIYKSLRTAKELGIFPEDYIYFIETDEETLFLELMNNIYLEENFIEFDIKIYNYEKSKECFKVDFIKVLAKVMEKDYVNMLNKKSKIYLQGFHYITPMQERIIRYLSYLDVEIIPVLCFNPNNHEVNKIIYKTFENFSVKNISKLNGDDKYLCDMFESMLSGNKENYYADIKDSQSISFEIYDDINSYNKEIINWKNSTYAINRNNLLDRISIFGGELKNPKKVSIKFYPIGIFLKEIYSSWNAYKRDIVVDVNSLSRIFETGILKAENNKSSKEYLYDIKLISNYFIDCETLDQWQERIRLLRENIVNCKYDKIKEYYGPFSIDENRLNCIEGILEEIRKITTIVFYKDDYDIDMEIHLTNLKQIVEKNIYSNEDNLMATELLKRIKDIIKNRQGNIRVKNIHLYEAISLYISDVENYLEEDCDLKIFTLDSIEAVSIGDDEKVLVCDFDRDNFPSTKTSENMYLNREKLSKIMDHKSEELDKKVIFRELIMLDNKDIIGRYIFWLMLKCPSEKVVCRLIDREKENEHFYESLLKGIGVQSKIRRNMDETCIDIKNINPTDFKLKEGDVRSFKKNDFYKYCPMRGFFYRLNGDRQCYTDNFVIKHFISDLFASILQQENEGNYYKILSCLIELFPQYGKLDKDNITNFTKGKRKNYKGGDSQLGIIPYNFDINKNYNKFLESIKKEEKWTNVEALNYIIRTIPPLANSGENTCKFCVYRDRCKSRLSN